MFRKMLLQGMFFILILNSGFGQYEIINSDYPHNKVPYFPVVFSVMGSTNPNLNPYVNHNTSFHISIVSGRVRHVQGLQVGGITNVVTSDFIGYDATGIYSKVGGNFSGFQSTGIMSDIEGNYIGMQESGLYSHVGKNFTGIQVSGVLNRVDGNFTGAQIGGVTNHARNVRFIQIAGILNEATNVEGIQIAGVVNRAEHVKGIQIGVINRSKSLDGIAIGLVNLSESGSVHAVAWATAPESIQFGVKFAPNDYWYTMLTLGNLGGSKDEKPSRVFQSRVGVHLDLVQNLYIELDMGGGNSIPNNLFDWDDEDSFQGVLEGRVSVGSKIGKRMAVYGGLSNTRTGDDNGWFQEGSSELQPFVGFQF